MPESRNTPPGNRHVYLVDDDNAVRHALTFLFQSHGLDVQTFASGESFLASIGNASAPPQGCVVLDVRMEPLSGLQVHNTLVSRQLRILVIFLSGHGDIPMAVEALKKGAFDFVEKPFGDAALVERVQAAMALDASLQSQANQESSLERRLANLTQRELDIMHRVAAGMLNKVIADALHISMRTVEVYRARVFAKLDVRSAAELATLLAHANRGKNTGQIEIKMAGA